MYTTNAIESLNMQLRKVLKTRGHFPNDEAAVKLMYLALRRITKKWLKPPMHWSEAALQLVVQQFVCKLVSSGLFDFSTSVSC